jgi:hypothetical protein
MRIIFIAAAWLATVGAAPAASVGDLGWLSGAWVSRDGDKWTEEYWTPPRGSVMIGAGLSGKGRKAEWFEHMRIAADKDGALAFFAMPGGAPASRFPLVWAEKGEIVFENAAHDFPQRIRYRREGEALVTTISRIDGSKAQSWIFKRP